MGRTTAAGATLPLWRRPAVVAGVIGVVLAGAIAGTTTVVAADDPDAAGVGPETFDPVQYADERYESEVVPAITDNAVDITELLPAIVADPEAAGEQFGHKDGVTSPYAYPVSGTGVAGPVEGTLMPVAIDGLPEGVEVVIQVGPAINGTALRDATGLIGFDDFLNQIEYADVSTELNNKVKEQVLADFDAAAASGRTVDFVGAFSYGSNTALLQVTPVELEVQQ
jgi:predicted lipoprotein